MYATTGITNQQLDHLVEYVETLYAQHTITYGTRCIPDVRTRVIIVLMYLRLNIPQQAIAEIHHISQPTVSRLICVLGDLLSAYLASFTPSAGDVNPDEDLIIDGTLCPMVNYQDHPENYSGKHHQTGMNIQVACNLYHELVFVSDPLAGSTHDSAALRATGLLRHFASKPGRMIADRGYIGVADVTPVRKPPGGQLDDEDRAYNRSINQIRWVIESIIAHLKGFKCLAVRYRRPYSTFRTALSLVVGLLFYNPRE